jgi:hypothetical protein
MLKRQEDGLALVIKRASIPLKTASIDPAVESFKCGY